MKAFFRPSIWLLISSLNLLVAADSYFFNNTEGLGPNAANVSAGCVTALRAEIPCNNHFITLMTSDSYAPLGNKTIQDIFCNSTCSTGLATYRSAVVSACSKDVQPLPGLPATWWVDSATSAFKQFCLKDTTTGNYCTDILPSLTNNENAETPITDLPVATLCSTCMISLFRQMQSTSYSNYDPNLAIIWGDVQAKCQLSYPTDVLPLDTNVTTPGGFAAPGTGFTGCLTGETYTVVSGDNCNAIAQSQSVSVGTLIAINNLYTDCRNLWAGATLCLPPKCTLYQVQSGDKCDKIANLTSTSFQQLTAWNPAINSYCTNLIAGQAICASPPGGEVSMTTIPGATTTQTGIYASATVDRPNAVASGTTRFCGKYYLVMPGDFCQLVVVNNTITLDLFLAINPSIDAACSNLLLGVNYCVRPTEQWNGTSSTIVDPPAATPPGSTPECYEWYTVVSGDWCGKITDTYSITMAQLQFWNPDLKSDCSNLLLDEAYCVHGVFDLTTTTAAGAKAKRTAPAAGGAPVPRETGGGVPYGWPGLGAPRVQDGIGKARREL